MNANQTGLREKAAAAKKAQLALKALNDEERNKILQDLVQRIQANEEQILAKNKEDQKNAEELLQSGKINASVFHRLKLDSDKIRQLAVYPETVAGLEDSVGKIEYQTLLDDGLELSRVKVPMGLIAVIFESRPEVVIQISSLMIKSCNAVFLKGGKETKHTNRLLAELVRESLNKYGLEDCVFMLEGRDAVGEILNFDDQIDLIIPRGGNELVSFVMDNTKIPVLGHRDGVCHLYVDTYADETKTLNCAIDSKIDYPSACNAVETLLVHRDRDELLKKILEKLHQKGVGLVCDETSAKIAEQSGFPFEKATEDSWRTEYGDKIVNIKVVKDCREAMDHINYYGSGHTESILTENEEIAQIFFEGVDSANLFHNASTRFCDGFVFGLGAEVGISCEKIHARGPVGIEGLLTTKYLLKGNGQTKAEYKNKPFLHRRII